jgi:hypothetical protein
LVNKVSSSILGNTLMKTIMNLSSKTENVVSWSEGLNFLMNDVINEMIKFEDNPSVQIETSQNP